LRTALSHVNIVVDLYNKALSKKALIPDLRTWLGNAILEGGIDPFQDTRWLQDYEPAAPPDTALLDRLERVYEQQGKTFARYLEAIYCAERGDGIEQVVKRAISHSRPPRWSEVDYRPVDRARFQEEQIGHGRR
jgi:hypothetical protein